jgi:hypothetical protein
MSHPNKNRHPGDGEAAKPRSKRRYDDREREKKRPSVMDRIRARRQNPDDDPRDYLEDLDMVTDFDDPVDFEGFDDDLEGGFGFDDVDDDER